MTDGETNATLRKGDDVAAITLERAAELLADKRARGPAPKKTAARKPAKKTVKKAATKTASKTATKAADKRPAARKAAKKAATKRPLTATSSGPDGYIERP